MITGAQDASPKSGTGTGCSASRSKYMDDDTSVASLAVLVVEDEPLVLMDTVASLEDEGFVVFQAASAAAAIAILENRTEIRVVFTDIEMPGTMDGLELAHYVRRRWPPTMIFITSGRRLPQKSSLPERTRFVVKPYSRSDLALLANDVRDELRA